MQGLLRAVIAATAVLSTEVAGVRQAAVSHDTTRTKVANDKDDAQIIKVSVVDDQFCDVEGVEPESEQKHPKLCTPGALKPMRAKPFIMQKDLVLTEDGTFVGSLNGWPAYTNLKLHRMSTKEGGMFGGHPHTYAEFELPEWMAAGWLPASPGFVFWYTPPSADDEAQFQVGQQILDDKRLDWNRELILLKASVVAHRYANDHSLKGSQTFHEAVILEWEGGAAPTLVELAWLNGLGGYGGKSNWYDDKTSKDGTALYRAMTQIPGMIQPWDSHRAEVRILDLEVANFEEFEAYMTKYDEIALGPERSAEARFHDIHFPAKQTEVRVGLSKRDVFGAILKYMEKDGHYDEMTRNCQTFATDLWRFLTGRNNIGVYTGILKPFYTSKVQNFQ